MAKVQRINSMPPQEITFELNRGGKFVCCRFCFSAVIVTVMEGTDIYLARSGESRITEGLPGHLSLSPLVGGAFPGDPSVPCTPYGSTSMVARTLPPKWLALSACKECSGMLPRPGQADRLPGQSSDHLIIRAMKSQAETAGRLTNSVEPLPQRGTVLRDVEISMSDGTRTMLGSLRGSCSLVMVFTAGRELRNLVAHLAGSESTLKEHNARVLIVATARDQLVANSELQSQLVLLAIDDNKGIHRALGATDAAQNPLPAIYITDRFGEVFAAFRSEDPSSLPSTEEIVRWLEFIERQCEECSPSEWQE
jgi:hypothetical protein